MRRRRLGTRRGGARSALRAGYPSETRYASARSSAAPLATDAAMADRADSPAARVRPRVRGRRPAAAAPRRR